MNPLLGSHHHQQESLNMSCPSHGNFYRKRSLQCINHQHHPATPLHKRPRTEYHYSNTTPTNQHQSMQQNRPPEAPPQNPSHVERSLGRPSTVPTVPAFPIQIPGFILPSAGQTTVDMNNEFIISTLLRELISVVGNYQQLQAMLPKTLPEGLVDLIIMQCTEQQTVDNDHLWLEFDHAKIKVYNESAIRALYADLPRQCTTCGLRFKAQEEHGQHMDWHVRKNRAAKKNIMSKQMQSRKWFPTSSFLLKASEVNGMPNACAPAFNSTGTVKEENNFEEPSAVFADEDQKNCPLCMEAFDEYFSDETNDWMYRGTVYMEEARASTRRLYKSLVGRIVHAKCLYTKDEIQHLPNISGIYCITATVR